MSENSFEKEQEVLMNVYNSIKNNNSSEKTPIKENITESNNDINIGDFIVFDNRNKELSGEVKKIMNENYLVRGNFDGKIKSSMLVSFDDIKEHYPKNVHFDNSTNNTPEDFLNEPVLKNKKDILKEDFLKEPIIKDNSGNTNKSVVFFPIGTKQKDIENQLKKYSEAKYFIVEKNNELHVVNFKNDKKFKIKPFVESVITHILKNKMIKEDISRMKVVGNDSFCIMKNPPNNFKGVMKNILKKLLK